MKKLFLRVTLASALMVIAAGSLHAQGKIRIAILDFSYNAEQSYWFSSRLADAARNNIDTAFSENPTLSSKFSVVERDKLALVMKEQGLGSSGAVDPATAAKVGRILGVQYMLVGGIDKFAINTTGGGLSALGGIGGKMTQADTMINMRFIDTTTAERVISLSAGGNVKKGGGSFRGNSLSREAEWGLASEALEKASKSVVDKLVTGGYLDRMNAAATAGGVEGKIIKVAGNQAWINLGSSSGIKVGDQFKIFNVGEALKDPDTGAVLGADEKETGSGQVTEVQAKYAIITFKGTAKAKDTVRQ